MRILAAVRLRACALLGLLAAAVVFGGCTPRRMPEKPQKPDQHKAAAATTEAVAPRKVETPPAVPAPTLQKPAAKPKKIAKAEPAEEKLTEEVEQIAEKPRDLGPPLVDAPANLKRLSPDQLVWVDPVKKQVVLQGEVCKAGYPLEFFATYSNRSYEAVVAVNVKPSIVHAGLLAVGAEPGHPARFQPEFVPPTGTEIAIEVRWKNADGKLESAPAQHWIRNIKTRKELDKNWVFAGSSFVTDKETGKEYYQADSGELICVLSLPNAMLDLPVQGYGAIEARSYEAFEEHLPPQGTPITLILKPILKPKPVSGPKKAAAAPVLVPSEAEVQAAAAAAPWLALVDHGEFAQCWETAAGPFRESVERREFIQRLGTMRKPLGKLVARQLESRTYVTKLPGVPEGCYVVLQYKSSFERRQTATETVRLMFDRDRQWRVMGYRAG